MEKVYKTMRASGAGNIILGIVVLLTGVTTGILLIVSGGKLLHDKKRLMF